ncbi:MAG TPA: DNA topoisomerase [Candidatus Egerieisoma faecipullorum]|uniref:DNA topoisomerase (ATP-hydrolyzing) n=1 Tax=Candidatus Egerieisoma faecipullorum TaxID=2840963 RepID=A0A9D1I7D6_9CLOT|nr:DNA topoisomerase [Candidatus Egerieisoma faecipullorum]
MAKNAYSNESISALKGPDRVRLKPAAILGSDGLEGCEHTFIEILANSIDEAREGYGKVIEVTRFRDRSIQIRDYGRGCPVDYNEKEKRYNWELVYCELYAGGKYNNNAGENYEYSLGTNGLGSCATQYSSEYMDVTVYKDGFKYELHFEKGYNKGGLKKEPCEYKQSGTLQRWKPDLEVFTDINIPLDFFTTILKKQAVVNAGLKFKLYDEESNRHYEFLYENGITDYVRELSEGKELTSIQYCESAAKGRDRADKPEYKLKMQLAFCFNNEINLIEYYHNSSYLENGGSPDKAVRSAFVSEIDKYIKAQGKYNKDETKITFADIQDSLILVTNSFSTMTSYENQTKKAINNKFIQEAMTDFIKQRLEIYFIENKTEADKIMEQVLVNKRSRESAEKQRINIKKKLQGNVDMINRVKKFVDCRTKDPLKRELYIVEGDSALGSVKLGRDSEFQAIMPLRGKILNCLKADYGKIFDSDVIVDLVRVLGCGIEVKSKHKDLALFDLSSLKWAKIIICTDADFDGFQIRTLVLAMIYRLMPSLIHAGKVYIAETPLYEITCKGKTYFAYDDKEKTKILDRLGTQSRITIQRSKGLGENEPDMMWETTMNPESRRLIKVMPEDAENTAYYFEMLLGDALDERKKHIRECGHLYLDEIDVM